MGFVAGSAQFFLDWAVFIRCPFCSFLHFFVTTETQRCIIRPFLQKFLEVGGMGGVTSGAPSFSHGLMYDPRIFYIFYHFLGFLLMAVYTEGKLVFLKIVF
jgi:hypothetical protein